MKVKFINKTNSPLWMGDFCFIPGTSIADINKEQKDKLEEIKKNNNAIKNAIAKKIYIIEYAENFEVEVQPENKEK